MYNELTEPHETKATDYCSICGGELYPGSKWIVFNGKHICKDCFFSFAADYFGPELAASGIERSELFEA